MSRRAGAAARSTPLRFDAVTKTLAGHQALREVSFECPPGSVTALLGPNGAGKTTTVALATGLRRPDSGEVAAFGERAGSAWARRQVSVVPQEIGFPDSVSVARCLGFVAAQRDRPALGPEPDEVAAALGMTPLLDRRAGGLSGGERRKLAVALGLVRAPRLLIMDEATTNLDEHTRALVWMLVEQHRDVGGTVLVTSHILADIEAHADRVVALNSGQVVRAGSVAEIRAGLGGSLVSVRVPSDRAAEIRTHLATTGLGTEALETGAGTPGGNDPSSATPPAGTEGGGVAAADVTLSWQTATPFELIAALGTYDTVARELQVRPVPLTAMLRRPDDPAGEGLASDPAAGTATTNSDGNDPGRDRRRIDGRQASER